MRLLNKSIVCVLVVVSLMLGVGVSDAFAGSAWWHLYSGARPTSLNRGTSTNEVQEVTVTAKGGEFILGEPVATSKLEFFHVNGKGEEEAEFAIFPDNATATQVEEGLQRIPGYGAGNVKVTPGSGSGKYVVTFTGELAYQPLLAISTKWSEEFGFTTAGQIAVSELAHGDDDGQIVVTAANMGDAATSETTTIVDTLPAGMEVATVAAIAGRNEANRLGVVSCSHTSQTVTCSYPAGLPAYEQIELQIGVSVDQSAVSGSLNQLSVSGGGAPNASISRPVSIGEPLVSGVEHYELGLEEERGKLDSQAGSHPFQFTTTLGLNQLAGAEPVAQAKDLRFNLPAGLIGNPTPFAQCTDAQFLTRVKELDNECPKQTVVGVARVTINDPTAAHLSTFTLPLFNLKPSVGEPARFGFLVLFTPVYIDTSVRTGGDYGVTATVSNIAQTVGFLKNEVTFWGVPGDPRHDAQRDWGCLEQARGETPSLLPCNPLEANTPPPLLSLPTSCDGPLQTSVETDSWNEHGLFRSFPSSEPMGALDGCNRLPFDPSIDVAADGQAGSTPTGLTVDVHVPQAEGLNATGFAPADVKSMRIALPQGVTLNPAAADGLESCSITQAALSSAGPSGCPDASKVATVEVTTPLLVHPLIGAAYLAAQNANPFGSLVALYLIFEDPVSGVKIKVAGEVKPDPVTGQLFASFQTPQAPFEDAKVHFFGGNRAPLGTPAQCGSYTSTGSFTPWSTQAGEGPHEASSTFEITSGPNGGTCQSPLPFSPSLTAGTTSIQAGGFSPFTMTMSREDGSQNLQAISLHMPPGISGLLSSVKLCGEPQADEGLCGPESEIGETTVSVGLGGDPFSVKGGKVFVTAGYEGAPYGLSIVNPAKAGPYDLEQGTPCDCVVVRAKIEVDPITAQLTITSDNTGPYKIPTILDGIPLQIKHVNVLINRPGFTFNPTNCNPMSITGSLSSSEGATSSLSVPLQVTNCAVLAFKPGFSVSTNGKTSRATGASLHVKLTYPIAPFGSQANIKSVKVDLPKQLPSQLKTLQKACPDSTFDANPANCDPASRIGTAKATTPLLPVALTGPVYFVSHAGLKFPELVIVLSGYGTTVQLHAETFISKTGITSSTFRTVPDVPVGAFELTLPQGKFPALAAPANNLCKEKLKMPTVFTAQNGVTLKQNTPITVSGCPKHTAKKARKPHTGKAPKLHTGKARRKK